MPTEKTITRRELYDRVWAEPMSRLAREFGLSDVGIAKICRKHDVPRPPRGYWAKKQFGQEPAQIPLPHAGKDYPIEMPDPTEKPPLPPGMQEEVDDATAQERKEESKISVAETLRGAHQLVSLANQEFQGVKTGPNGLIEAPEKVSLDIHVSKSSLRRALLIMDALLKALEERGYAVSAGPTVTILETSVRFGICEQFDTQEEEPEDNDLEGRYVFAHNRVIQNKVPSGRLTLRIHSSPPRYWGTQSSRSTWRDGEKQRLEDRLNSFVAGLVKVAARLKAHEEEEERREKERREQERREAESARVRAEKHTLAKAERARVNELHRQAENWRKSRTLREFIEAAKEKHLAEQAGSGLGEDFAKWLEWALHQADRLDPLRKSPPSILDEDSGEEEERDQRPAYSPGYYQRPSSTGYYR